MPELDQAYERALIEAHMRLQEGYDARLWAQRQQEFTQLEQFRRLSQRASASFLELYVRTPIGTPTRAASPNHTHTVSYSAVCEANVVPRLWSGESFGDEPANPGQGMTRGGWCGRPAGPFPGYRVAAR